MGEQRARDGLLERGRFQNSSRATAPKNNSTANNRGISSDNWRTRGETKFLEMNHYSLDYVALGDE